MLSKDLLKLSRLSVVGKRAVGTVFFQAGSIVLAFNKDVSSRL